MDEAVDYEAIGRGRGSRRAAASVAFPALGSSSTRTLPPPSAEASNASIQHLLTPAAGAATIHSTARTLDSGGSFFDPAVRVKIGGQRSVVAGRKKKGAERIINLAFEQNKRALADAIRRNNGVDGALNCRQRVDLTKEAFAAAPPLLALEQSLDAIPAGCFEAEVWGDYPEDNPDTLGALLKAAQDRANDYSRKTTKHSQRMYRMAVATAAEITAECDGLMDPVSHAQSIVGRHEFEALLPEKGWIAADAREKLSHNVAAGAPAPVAPSTGAGAGAAPVVFSANYPGAAAWGLSLQKLQQKEDLPLLGGSSAAARGQTMSKSAKPPDMFDGNAFYRALGVISPTAPNGCLSSEVAAAFSSVEATAVVPAEASAAAVEAPADAGATAEAPVRSSDDESILEALLGLGATSAASSAATAASSSPLPSPSKGDLPSFAALMGMGPASESDNSTGGSSAPAASPAAAAMEVDSSSKLSSGASSGSGRLPTCFGPMDAAVLLARRVQAQRAVLRALREAGREAKMVQSILTTAAVRDVAVEELGNYYKTQGPPPASPTASLDPRLSGLLLMVHSSSARLSALLHLYSLEGVSRDNAIRAATIRRLTSKTTGGEGLPNIPAVDAPSAPSFFRGDFSALSSSSSAQDFANRHAANPLSAPLRPLPTPQSLHASVARGSDALSKAGELAALHQAGYPVQQLAVSVPSSSSSGGSSQQTAVAPFLLLVNAVMSTQPLQQLLEGPSAWHYHPPAEFLRYISQPSTSVQSIAPTPLGSSTVPSALQCVADMYRSLAEMTLRDTSSLPDNSLLGSLNTRTPFSLVASVVASFLGIGGGDGFGYGGRFRPAIMQGSTVLYRDPGYHPMHSAWRKATAIDIRMQLLELKRQSSSASASFAFSGSGGGVASSSGLDIGDDESEMLDDGDEDFAASKGSSSRAGRQRQDSRFDHINGTHNMRVTKYESPSMEQAFWPTNGKDGQSLDSYVLGHGYSSSFTPPLSFDMLEPFFEDIVGSSTSVASLRAGATSSSTAVDFPADFLNRVASGVERVDAVDPSMLVDSGQNSAAVAATGAVDNSMALDIAPGDASSTAQQAPAAPVVKKLVLKVGGASSKSKQLAAASKSKSAHHAHSVLLQALMSVFPGLKDCFLPSGSSDSSSTASSAIVASSATSAIDTLPSFKQLAKWDGIRSFPSAAGKPSTGSFAPLLAFNTAGSSLSQLWRGQLHLNAVLGEYLRLDLKMRQAGTTSSVPSLREIVLDAGDVVGRFCALAPALSKLLGGHSSSSGSDGVKRLFFAAAAQAAVEQVEGFRLSTAGISTLYTTALDAAWAQPTDRSPSAAVSKTALPDVFDSKSPVGQQALSSFPFVHRFFSGATASAADASAKLQQLGRLYAWCESAPERGAAQKAKEAELADKPASTSTSSALASSSSSSSVEPDLDPLGGNAVGSRYGYRQWQSTLRDLWERRPLVRPQTTTEVQVRSFLSLTPSPPSFSRLAVPLDRGTCDLRGGNCLRGTSSLALSEALSESATLSELALMTARWKLQLAFPEPKPANGSPSPVVPSLAVAFLVAFVEEADASATEVAPSKGLNEASNANPIIVLRRLAQACRTASPDLFAYPYRFAAEIDLFLDRFVVHELEQNGFVGSSGDNSSESVEARAASIVRKTFSHLTPASPVQLGVGASPRHAAAMPAAANFVFRCEGHGLMFTEPSFLQCPSFNTSSAEPPSSLECYASVFLSLMKDDVNACLTKQRVASSALSSTSEQPVVSEELSPGYMRAYLASVHVFVGWPPFSSVLTTSPVGVLEPSASISLSPAVPRLGASFRSLIEAVGVKARGNLFPLLPQAPASLKLQAKRKQLLGATAGLDSSRGVDWAQPSGNRSGAGASGAADEKVVANSVGGEGGASKGASMASGNDEGEGGSSRPPVRSPSQSGVPTFSAPGALWPAPPLGRPYKRGLEPVPGLRIAIGAANFVVKTLEQAAINARQSAINSRDMVLAAAIPEGAALVDQYFGFMHGAHRFLSTRGADGAPSQQECSAASELAALWKRQVRPRQPSCKGTVLQEEEIANFKWRTASSSTGLQNTLKALASNAKAFGAELAQKNMAPDADAGGEQALFLRAQEEPAEYVLLLSAVPPGTLPGGGSLSSLADRLKAQGYPFPYAPTLDCRLVSAKPNVPCHFNHRPNATMIQCTCCGQWKHWACTKLPDHLRPLFQRKSGGAGVSDGSSKLAFRCSACMAPRYLSALAEHEAALEQSLARDKLPRAAFALSLLSQLRARLGIPQPLHASAFHPLTVALFQPQPPPSHASAANSDRDQASKPGKRRREVLESSSSGGAAKTGAVAYYDLMSAFAADADSTGSSAEPSSDLRVMARGLGVKVAAGVSNEVVAPFERTLTLMRAADEVARQLLAPALPKASKRAFAGDLKRSVATAVTLLSSSPAAYGSSAVASSSSSGVASSTSVEELDDALLMEDSQGLAPEAKRRKLGDSEVSDAHSEGHLPAASASAPPAASAPRPRLLVDLSMLELAAFAPAAIAERALASNSAESEALMVGSSGAAGGGAGGSTSEGSEKAAATSKADVSSLSLLKVIAPYFASPATTEGPLAPALANLRKHPGRKHDIASYAPCGDASKSHHSSSFDPDAVASAVRGLSSLLLAGLTWALASEETRKGEAAQMTAAGLFLPSVATSDSEMAVLANGMALLPSASVAAWDLPKLSHFADVLHRCSSAIKESGAEGTESALASQATSPSFLLALEGALGGAPSFLLEAPSADAAPASSSRASMSFAEWSAYHLLSVIANVAYDQCLNDEAKKAAIEAASSSYRGFYATPAWLATLRKAATAVAGKAEASISTAAAAVASAAEIANGSLTNESASKVLRLYKQQEDDAGREALAASQGGSTMDLDQAPGAPSDVYARAFRPPSPHSVIAPAIAGVVALSGLPLTASNGENGPISLGAAKVGYFPLPRVIQFGPYAGTEEWVLIWRAKTLQLAKKTGLLLRRGFNPTASAPIANATSTQVSAVGPQASSSSSVSSGPPATGGSASAGSSAAQPSQTIVEQFPSAFDAGTTASNSLAQAAYASMLKAAIEQKDKVGEAAIRRAIALAGESLSSSGLSTGAGIASFPPVAKDAEQQLTVAGLKMQMNALTAAVASANAAVHQAAALASAEASQHSDASSSAIVASDSAAAADNAQSSAPEGASAALAAGPAVQPSSNDSTAPQPAEAPSVSAAVSENGPSTKSLPAAPAPSTAQEPAIVPAPAPAPQIRRIHLKVKSSVTTAPSPQPIAAGSSASAASSASATSGSFNPYRTLIPVLRRLHSLPQYRQNMLLPCEEEDSSATVWQRAKALSAVANDMISDVTKPGTSSSAAPSTEVASAAPLVPPAWALVSVSHDPLKPGRVVNAWSIMQIIMSLPRPLPAPIAAIVRELLTTAKKEVRGEEAAPAALADKKEALLSAARASALAGAAASRNIALQEASAGSSATSQAADENASSGPSADTESIPLLRNPFVLPWIRKRVLPLSALEPEELQGLAKPSQAAKVPNEAEMQLASVPKPSPTENDLVQPQDDESALLPKLVSLVQEQLKCDVRSLVQPDAEAGAGDGHEDAKLMSDLIAGVSGRGGIAGGRLATKPEAGWLGSRLSASAAAGSSAADGIPSSLPRCTRPGCLKDASTYSKYCSTACGMAVARARLLAALKHALKLAQAAPAPAAASSADQDVDAAHAAEQQPLVKSLGPQSPLSLAVMHKAKKPALMERLHRQLQFVSALRVSLVAMDIVRSAMAACFAAGRGGMFDPRFPAVLAPQSSFWWFAPPEHVVRALEAAAAARDALQRRQPGEDAAQPKPSSWAAQVRGYYKARALRAGQAFIEAVAADVDVSSQEASATYAAVLFDPSFFSAQGQSSSAAPLSNAMRKKLARKANAAGLLADGASTSVGLYSATETKAKSSGSATSFPRQGSFWTVHLKRAQRRAVDIAYRDVENRLIQALMGDLEGAAAVVPLAKNLQAYVEGAEGQSRPQMSIQASTAVVLSAPAVLSAAPTDNAMSESAHASQDIGAGAGKGPAPANTAEQGEGSSGKHDILSSVFDRLDVAVDGGFSAASSSSFRSSKFASLGALYASEEAARMAVRDMLLNREVKKRPGRPRSLLDPSKMLLYQAQRFRRIMRTELLRIVKDAANTGNAAASAYLDARRGLVEQYNNRQNQISQGRASTPEDEDLDFLLSLEDPQLESTAVRSADAPFEEEGAGPGDDESVDEEGREDGEQEGEQVEAMSQSSESDEESEVMESAENTHQENSAAPTPAASSAVSASAGGFVPGGGKPSVIRSLGKQPPGAIAEAELPLPAPSASLLLKRRRKKSERALNSKLLDEVIANNSDDDGEDEEEFWRKMKATGSTYIRGHGYVTAATAGKRRRGRPKKKPGRPRKNDRDDDDGDYFDAGSSKVDDLDANGDPQVPQEVAENPYYNPNRRRYEDDDDDFEFVPHRASAAPAAPSSRAAQEFAELRQILEESDSILKNARKPRGRGRGRGGAKGGLAGRGTKAAADRQVTDQGEGQPGEASRDADTTMDEDNDDREDGEEDVTAEGPAAKRPRLNDESVALEAASEGAADAAAADNSSGGGAAARKPRGVWWAAVKGVRTAEQTAAADGVEVGDNGSGGPLLSAEEQLATLKEQEFARRKLRVPSELKHIKTRRERAAASSADGAGATGFKGDDGADEEPEDAQDAIAAAAEREKLKQDLIEEQTSLSSSFISLLVGKGSIRGKADEPEETVGQKRRRAKRKAEEEKAAAALVGPAEVSTADLLASVEQRYGHSIACLPSNSPVGSAASALSDQSALLPCASCGQRAIRPGAPRLSHRCFTTAVDHMKLGLGGAQGADESADDATGANSSRQLQALAPVVYLGNGAGLPPLLESVKGAVAVSRAPVPGSTASLENLQPFSTEVLVKIREADISTACVAAALAETFRALVARRIKELEREATERNARAAQQKAFQLPQVQRVLQDGNKQIVAAQALHQAAQKALDEGLTEFQGMPLTTENIEELRQKATEAVTQLQRTLEEVMEAVMKGKLVPMEKTPHFYPYLVTLPPGYGLVYPHAGLQTLSSVAQAVGSVSVQPDSILKPGAPAPKPKSSFTAKWTAGAARAPYFLMLPYTSASTSSEPTAVITAPRFILPLPTTPLSVAQSEAYRQLYFDYNLFKMKREAWAHSASTFSHAVPSSRVSAAATSGAVVVTSERLKELLTMLAGYYGDGVDGSELARHPLPLAFKVLLRIDLPRWALPERTQSSSGGAASSSSMNVDDSSHSNETGSHAPPHVTLQEVRTVQAALRAIGDELKSRLADIKAQSSATEVAGDDPAAFSLKGMALRDEVGAVCQAVASADMCGCPMHVAAAKGSLDASIQRFVEARGAKFAAEADSATPSLNAAQALACAFDSSAALSSANSASSAASRVLHEYPDEVVRIMSLPGAGGNKLMQMMATCAPARKVLLEQVWPALNLSKTTAADSAEASLLSELESLDTRLVHLRSYLRGFCSKPRRFCSQHHAWEVRSLDALENIEAVIKGRAAMAGRVLPAAPYLPVSIAAPFCEPVQRDAFLASLPAPLVDRAMPLFAVSAAAAGPSTFNLLVPSGGHEIAGGRKPHDRDATIKAALTALIQQEQEKERGRLLDAKKRLVASLTASAGAAPSEQASAAQASAAPSNEDTAPQDSGNVSGSNIVPATGKRRYIKRSALADASSVAMAGSTDTILPDAPETSSTAPQGSSSVAELSTVRTAEPAKAPKAKARKAPPRRRSAASSTSSGSSSSDDGGSTSSSSDSDYDPASEEGEKMKANHSRGRRRSKSSASETSSAYSSSNDDGDDDDDDDDDEADKGRARKSKARASASSRTSHVRNSLSSLATSSGLSPLPAPSRSRAAAAAIAQVSGDGAGKKKQRGGGGATPAAPAAAPAVVDNLQRILNMLPQELMRTLSATIVGASERHAQERRAGSSSSSSSASPSAASKGPDLQMFLVDLYRAGGACTAELAAASGDAAKEAEARQRMTQSVEEVIAKMQARYNIKPASSSGTGPSPPAE